MSREVKLTAREPDRDSAQAGERGMARLDVDAEYGCWTAMHDSAPDDATEALESLVYLLEDRSYWRKEIGEFSWERSVDYHLERLRATPAGAELITQALKERC